MDQHCFTINNTFFADYHVTSEQKIQGTVYQLYKISCECDLTILISKTKAFIFHKQDALRAKATISDQPVGQNNTFNRLGFKKPYETNRDVNENK